MRGEVVIVKSGRWMLRSVVGWNDAGDFYWNYDGLGWVMAREYCIDIPKHVRRHLVRRQRKKLIRKGT